MATSQQIVEGLVASGSMTQAAALAFLARMNNHAAAPARKRTKQPKQQRERVGGARQQEAVDDDADDHDRDLGAVGAAAAGDTHDASGNDGAGTYELYVPKLVKEGKPHPDPVVETLTLAAMTPPRPTYKHHLQAAVKSGALSSLQLESVIYACQRFEGPRLPDGSRAGFFLGDGAGVGKGRQLAGLAYEHWLTGGRRVLWLSVSSDLRIDAARDLDDLGMEKLPLYPPRDSASAVVPTGVLDACGYKDGVLFVTYSLLISRSAKGSRLDQVVRWLSNCPQGGLICFDECHKAKNLLKGKGAQSTRTAQVVVELQTRLPNAKVLYASATGASVPKNLAYMVRLGTFNCASFQDFLDTLEGGGLGSLELFSMGLKATGTYLCRTLSYTGAEFELASVPLTGALGKMYDRSSDFWVMMATVFREVDAGLGLGKKSKSRFKFAQFWGAHQRFFRQMLLSAKVPALAKAAADAVVNHNMAVVIGLQSTGEANTTAAREEAEEELDDFVSTPQIIVSQLIKTQFPIVVSVTDGADFRALYKQVLAVVTAWNSAPTVAAAAAAAAGASKAAAGAAAGAGSDSDDDIIEMGVKTLDEVEAEKRERAMRTGDFIDLTRAAVPSEQELEASRAAAAAAAAKLAANASARRAEEAARLKEQRDAVRAVAPQLLGDAGASAGPAAAAGAAKGALVGRCVVRGSGRDLMRGTVVSYAEESEMADMPLYTVQFDNGAIEELEEKELRPMLLSAAPSESGGGSDSVIVLSSDDEGRATRKARAPAPAPAPPKPAAVTGSVKVGGRALRAGARAARASASASRDDSGSDEESGSGSSDGDDSDVSGGSDDDEDVPIKRRVASKKPAEAAGRKKKTSGASSDSDEWGSEGSSEEEDSDGSGSGSGDESDSGGAPGFVPPAKPKVKKERAAAADADDEDELLQAVAPPPSKRVKTEGGGARAQKPDPNAPDLPDYRRAYFGGVYPPRATAARIAAATKGASADDDSDDEFPLDDDPHDKANLVTDGDGEEIYQVIDPWLLKTRDLMLSAVNALELPANPLDSLIDLLGGARNVAEMTGRKGHMVKDAAGKVRFVNRNEAAGVTVKALNVHERNAFMDAKKMVAIISEAASTGISLQADKRAINQRRRLHLTLELPWSADKAIQQFGRSHRSNQASAPVYRIFTTDVGGERRFAASAAKRLQSLGALLKGDRRALGAGASLREFDIENRYGSGALRRMYDDIEGRSVPLPGVTVPGGPDAIDDFRGAARSALVAVGLAEWNGRWAGLAVQHRPIVIKDQDKGSVSKFLNRLLGLPLADQKMLFTYFTETFEAIVAKAKSSGNWDEGLVALRAESIKLVDGYPSRIHTCPTSGAETHVVKLELDRGIPYAAALKRLQDFKAECDAAAPGTGRVFNAAKNGFWISTNVARNNVDGKPYIILATEIWTGNRRKQFRVAKPNVGNVYAHWLDDIENNYRHVTEAEAKPLWDWWFAYSQNCCSHGSGCKTRKAGLLCTHGLRRKTESLVVGAVLPVWSFIQKVIHSSKKPLRVVRCTTDDDQTFVGLHVEDDEMLQRIVGAVEAFDAGAMDSDDEAGAGAAAGAWGGAGSHEYEDEDAYYDDM